MPISDLALSCRYFRLAVLFDFIALRLVSKTSRCIIIVFKFGFCRLSVFSIFTNSASKFDFATEISEVSEITFFTSLTLFFSSSIFSFVSVSVFFCAITK